MNTYDISIFIKGNKFLFHHTSTEVRADQVLAILDAIDKNVKPELLKNIGGGNNECK